MLMQELNDVEIAALIAVRKRLKDGEYQFTANVDDYQKPFFVQEGDRRFKMAGKFFDMHVSNLEGACGTVACLGGWFLMELGHKVTNSTLYKFASTREGFFELCYHYPSFIDLRRAIIPPMAAVQAIDHYMFPEPGQRIWRHLTSQAGQAIVAQS